MFFCQKSTFWLKILSHKTKDVYPTQRIFSFTFTKSTTHKNKCSTKIFSQNENLFAKNKTVLPEPKPLYQNETVFTGTTSYLVANTQ